MKWIKVWGQIDNLQSIIWLWNKLFISLKRYVIPTVTSIDIGYRHILKCLYLSMCILFRWFGSQFQWWNTSVILNVFYPRVLLVPAIVRLYITDSSYLSSGQSLGLLRWTNNLIRVTVLLHRRNNYCKILDNSISFWLRVNKVNRISLFSYSLYILLEQHFDVRPSQESSQHECNTTYAVRGVLLLCFFILCPLSKQHGESV